MKIEITVNVQQKIKKLCPCFMGLSYVVHWIRVSTPFFHPAAPGSNPKHNNDAFSIQFQIVYLICHHIVKRTKINKKETGVGPYLKRYSPCLSNIKGSSDNGVSWSFACPKYSHKPHELTLHSLLTRNHEHKKRYFSSTCKQQNLNIVYQSSPCP